VLDRGTSTYYGAQHNTYLTLIFGI
jgi:hypothetical protein